MEPRNRCQGINSASLCSLAGRYDNPIPTRCLAPIEFLKIPAQVSNQRDREGRPCLTVGPACWTMGTDNLKLCTIGKNLFCTGPTGSAGQFFMLPLPSKIHRLNSVSKENKPVNILWISELSEWATVYILNHFAIINSVLSCLSYYFFLSFYLTAKA